MSTLADGTAHYACTAGACSSSFALNLKSGNGNRVFFGCFAAREADLSFKNSSLTTEN